MLPRYCACLLSITGKIAEPADPADLVRGFVVYGTDLVYKSLHPVLQTK